MNCNEEQRLKVLVRKYECTRCLKKMKKEHPSMIDCIFRHNNDEHLCKNAEKYKGDNNELLPSDGINKNFRHD